MLTKEDTREVLASGRGFWCAPFSHGEGTLMELFGIVNLGMDWAGRFKGDYEDFVTPFFLIS